MKKRTEVQVYLIIKGEEFEALEKIRQNLSAPSYKDAVKIAIQKTVEGISQ